MAHVAIFGCEVFAYIEGGPNRLVSVSAVHVLVVAGGGAVSAVHVLVVAGDGAWAVAGGGGTVIMVAGGGFGFGFLLEKYSQ